MPKTDARILSSRADKFAFAIAIAAMAFAGCVITATRPTQEYSDTLAALRAAKEVGADTLAPETYQQADEYFAKAKSHYRLKYYFEAREALLKSRTFAEKAEFEALRAGATRVSTVPKDPLAEATPGPKEPFTPPTNSKYVESAEQEANKPPPTPTPPPSPTPTPVILQLPTVPR